MYIHTYTRKTNTHTSSHICDNTPIHKISHHKISEQISLPPIKPSAPASSWTGQPRPVVQTLRPLFLHCSLPHFTLHPGLPPRPYVTHKARNPVLQRRGRADDCGKRGCPRACMRKASACNAGRARTRRYWNKQSLESSFPLAHARRVACRCCWKRRGVFAVDSEDVIYLVI